MANKKAVDVLKKKASLKKSDPSVVLIRANEMDGEKLFAIVNLSDFGKRAKKALSAFEGTRITKASLQALSATAKELGLKVKPYKEAEKAEESVEPKSKRVPPKFEPRTFTLGDKTLVELHPNVRNYVDKLFLIRSEEEVEVSPKTGKKLKKPRKVTVEKLVVCVYVGNPTAWFIDLETENASPLLVDFLSERKIWKFDEEGNFDKNSAPIGELIPVAIKYDEPDKKEAEAEDEA